jgi:membrane protease YdiL (CAAX protease family)
MLFAWLTRRFTAPPAVDTPAAPILQPRLWLQLLLIGFVIAITGLSAFNPPLWSAMVAWLMAFGERILPVQWVGGPGNAVANPVQYFVLPFVALLLLGARPAELGLGRGHRAWLVCAIWGAIPVLTWLVLLVLGRLAPQLLARRLIGNGLQNGFFEEFLFRGALQTRLQVVLNPTWALAVQALIFGLWHLSANTQMMDGMFWLGWPSARLCRQ